MASFKRLGDDLDSNFRNDYNDNIDLIEKDVNQSISDSSYAKQKAEDALNKSEQTQNELDQAILAGDSSPLAGQLSVGYGNQNYLSAQDRLIKEYESVQAKDLELETTITQNRQDFDDYKTNTDEQLADVAQQKADKTYVDGKIGSMGNTKTFKGSCTFAALPTAGMSVDDYWYVTDKLSNYAYNGTSWVDIGNNLNLGDGTITPKKLSFTKIGKNRLNPNNVILDNSLNASGLPYTAASYFVSDFMPVTPGENMLFAKNTWTDSNGKHWQYRTGGSDRFAFYDSNKNIIGSRYDMASIGTTTTTHADMIVPANAKWMRVASTSSDLTSSLIVATMTDYPTLASIDNGYEDYYEALDTSKIKGIPSKLSQLTNDVGLLGSDWAGKDIAFYGDSISAINNGLPNASWGYLVRDYLKMSSGIGRGIGGKTFSWANDYAVFLNSDGSYHSRNDSVKVQDLTPEQIPAGTTAHYGNFCSWDRITAMFPNTIKDSVDVVFVMGGTNDLIQSKEIGDTVFDSTNIKDALWQNDTIYREFTGDYKLDTFKGGIASTIMKLQKWMPNAVIVLGTPLSGHTTTAGTNMTSEFTNATTGLKTSDYAKAMKEVAFEFSVPCIDVFGTTGINQLNSNMFIRDGIHPYDIDGSNKGNKALARAVIGGMKGIIPNL